MAIQQVGSVTPAQGTSLIAAFQQGRDKRATTDAAAAKTEREVAIEGQKAEVRTGEIEAQNIENLDARQQQRIKSSVIGAAQLDGFLQSGNIEGGKAFLQRRRQDLGKRIAAGENVDTAETDEAIRLIDEDFEGLKQITSDSLEFGKTSGILKRPGGDRGLPADVVFADELGKARNEGDTQRVQDLLLAKKSLEKGQTVDDQGNIISAAGALESKEELAGASETGKQKAKLKLEPAVKAAVEFAKLEAKDQAELAIEFKTAIATFPQLQKVAQKLSDLGKVASFTIAQQKKDALTKELTGRDTAGSLARVEYINTVANEVLPLMKPTFGAAFTLEEGKSLKATLGDPDNTPAEKDAALNAFLGSKINRLETLKRLVPQDDIKILPDDAQGGAADLSEAELEAIINGQ